MADGEGFSDTLTAGLLIHTRAMAFSMNAPHDAVFVDRYKTKTREFACEQQSLIKTTFTFAFRMQRNGDDQVGAIKRFSLLGIKHQTCDSGGEVRLAL